MEKKLQENFRRNLRAAMQIRGLSQRECARRSGVYHANLSRILNGLQSPSLQTCEVLAAVVGCSVRELFASQADFEASVHASV